MRQASDHIQYHGQYVALVVAETPQEATAAARLVKVAYEPGEAPLSDFGDRPAAAPEHPVPGIDARSRRGPGQLRARTCHRRIGPRCPLEAPAAPVTASTPWHPVSARVAVLAWG